MLLCFSFVQDFALTEKKKVRATGEKQNFHQTIDHSSLALKRNQRNQTKTRGVSHCGLAFYINKYLKAKRRIMKTQIFHHAKIQSSKSSSKRNQNPSRYYNSYN